MDEKYIEMGEAAQEAVVTDQIKKVSAAAIPTDELEDTSKWTRYCVEEDCGVLLPEHRARRGLPRCTDCQGALEKRRKI